MSWHFQVIGTTFRHHVITRMPVNIGISALTADPEAPPGAFLRRYEHMPCPNPNIRI